MPSTRDHESHDARAKHDAARLRTHEFAARACVVSGAISFKSASGIAS